MQLFSDAWLQSMTMKNITSGFKVTGVFPVDRSAIQLPQDRRSAVFKAETLAVQSGLAYIPLYSPIKDDSSECVTSFQQSLNESWKGNPLS